MTNKEMYELIDVYFDGELEKGKEPILFTTLSADEEAREYFKNLNRLKTHFSNSMEEVPSMLDERILKAAAETGLKQNIFFNRTVYYAGAAVLVLILLISTFFFYSKSEEYKVQYADLTREVRMQNDKLELLMNALPAVEVREGILQKTDRPSEVKKRTGQVVAFVIPQVEVMSGSRQLIDLTREIKKQNEKLELLMNALPKVDVKGSYLQTKQIIVRPKI